jgi:hypothetical protein
MIVERMRQSRVAARGQTLVLWALTMLVLAVMVLVTLGIGMRVREATETQMVADAAAYSQAVTVARAFNGISTMNRAQVAATVAAAGTQAQISYSGVMLALLQAKCPDQTPDQSSSPGAKYWQADEAAANQMASLMGVAGRLYTAGVNLYANTMAEQISGQQLVGRIARAANREFDAPPEGSAKALKEVNGSDHVVTRAEISAKHAALDASVFTCSGAVCPVGDNTENLNATMGSLGWTWVRDRSAGGGITSGGAGYGSGTMKGPGADPAYHNLSAMETMTYKGVSGRNIHGHDHPISVVPPCPNIDPSDPASVVSAGEAWVMSNDDTPYSDYRTDQHVIPNVQEEGHAYQEGQGADARTFEKHTLGPCSWCPGIFPSTMSWNIAGKDGLDVSRRNDYGQPKLYSILERDYGTRRVKDPWNMFFRIGISDATGKTDFNNASKQQLRQLAQRNVKRTQVALSSGIVYYHRQIGGPGGDEGWREPPNFLNPFWRATLVSAVGANDDNPVRSLRQAGYPQHANALELLEREGFKGAGR